MEAVVDGIAECWRVVREVETAIFHRTVLTELPHRLGRIEYWNAELLRSGLYEADKAVARRYHRFVGRVCIDVCDKDGPVLAQPFDDLGHVGDEPTV